MKRRDFIVRSAYGLGAAWLSSQPFVGKLLSQTLRQKFNANDTVIVGMTGIKTSRLAMGTGTVGYAHTSHESSIGVKGVSDLLLDDYDHRLRVVDSADSYRRRPDVA